MHINFVTESKEETWILRRWCEEWTRRIENTTLTTHLPDMNVDCNIYVNYALFNKNNRSKLDIGYFTHRENTTEAGALKFDTIAQDVDYCFAQSEQTRDALLKSVPATKISIIRPGVADTLSHHTIVIGIVGRDYTYSDRKRYWIADDLEESMQQIYGRDAFSFLHATDVDYDKMDSFYKQIDYLLVTADKEGGPMPVIEALAMGVPVIAPYSVGWCDEFPCLRYANIYELHQILGKMISIRSLYDESAKEIETLVKKFVIMNKKKLEK